MVLTYCEASLRSDTINELGARVDLLDEVDDGGDLGVGGIETIVVDVKPLLLLAMFGQESMHLLGRWVCSASSLECDVDETVTAKDPRENAGPERPVVVQNFAKQKVSKCDMR